MEQGQLAARARYPARPWALRPGMGLLPMGFCCATSPVWRALYELESGRFQGFL